MKTSSYFLSFFIIFSLYACKHSYYDIEKRELNSGVRNDSIFFDLHFGMTSKEFYDRCWELNKQATSSGDVCSKNKNGIGWRFFKGF